MLAAHKHNASALFWYTQRYHEPRTEKHGAPAGVTVAVRYGRDCEAWTGDPGLGPRALDHGALVLGA